jgi:hypothetical protein
MGLDMEKVRTVIRSGITQQMGLAVRDVTCPESKGFRAGDSFECVVTTARGARVRVAVTQTNNYGGIRWETTGSDLLFAAAKAEPLLVEDLRERAGVDAKVDCGPRYREIEVGRSFECRATDSQGVAVPVTVTIRDAQGRFDWRIAPSAVEGAFASADRR